MRQIFTSLPYIHPAEPQAIVDIYRRYGTVRTIKRGEVLKWGGESSHIFFLEKGLCAYYIAGELSGRASILSLIIEGRTIGDLTAVIGTRCNVETRALVESTVLVVPPWVLKNAISSCATMAELVLANNIAKEESHLEGMVANFTLSPAQRLKILWKVLLIYSGQNPVANTWYRLPIRLSAEICGQCINLRRVSVSRLVSAWLHDGLIRRKGLDIEVKGDLFSDLYDWLTTTDIAPPDWRPD